MDKSNDKPNILLYCPRSDSLKVIIGYDSSGIPIVRDATEDEIAASAQNGNELTTKG